MAARDIMFNEFMPEVSDVLVKALVYALVGNRAGYLMFGSYDSGDSEAPTDAENAHATEVIQSTLQTQTIFYGSEHLIAYTLKSVANEVEASSTDQTGMFRFKTGNSVSIELTATQLVALKCLARSLCPHAEISSSRLIRAKSADTVKVCSEMLEKVLSAAPPEVDYGQNNVGIVVDGVLFDFPARHRVVARLAQSMLEATEI